MTTAEPSASSPAAEHDPTDAHDGNRANGPRPDGRVERVAVARIDLRFESLRLGHPSREGRARDHVDRGVYMPVLVSDGIAAGELVLVDGFKRVRAARALGHREIRVQIVAMDAVTATAAILASNSSPGGLTPIEEGLIVASLHQKHGLAQTDIAAKVSRSKSWVCRRLRLVDGLHADVLKDLRAGLLTPAVARELARLPRGNQAATARAVQQHRLTSRQANRLVDVLKASPDEAPTILADPRTHLPAPAKKGKDRHDGPRLSADGNRLRSHLLRLESAAQQARTVLRERPIGTLPEAECSILGVIGSGAFRAARRVIARGRDARQRRSRRRRRVRWAGSRREDAQALARGRSRPRRHRGDM